MSAGQVLFFRSVGLTKLTVLGKVCRRKSCALTWNQGVLDGMVGGPNVLRGGGDCGL
jgi:hypothetical protein